MILDLFRLDGRVALVTGAARGLGQAMALGLAEAGADIVGLSRGPSDETGEAVRALGRRYHPICCDLRTATVADLNAIVGQVVAEMGRLDILVNNAGVVIEPAPVMLMDERAWRRTLEVNATGTFLCCKHALPLIVEGGRGGAVVNISSLAAERPRPYMSAYAASKAAIVALTRSLAQEVGPHGIRVNAVLPGDVDTAMKRWGMALEARITGRSYEEVVEDFVKRIPLGRLATPEDVADVVAFLVSDGARFITGQAWLVTGGREWS